MVETIPLTGECLSFPHAMSSVMGVVIVFEKSTVPLASVTDVFPSVTMVPLTGLLSESRVILEVRFLVLIQVATVPSAKVIFPSLTLEFEIRTPVELSYK